MSIQMGRPRKLCRTQRTEFGLRERRNVAPVGAHLGHTPILGESTAGPGRVGSSAGRCKGGKRLRGDFLCRLRLNSIAGHGISLGGRRREQVRRVYMRPPARLQAERRTILSIQVIPSAPPHVPPLDAPIHIGPRSLTKLLSFFSPLEADERSYLQDSKAAIVGE